MAESASLQPEDIITRKGGQHPVPEPLRPHYIVVNHGGTFVEYVSDGFESESVKTPHFFTLKSSMRMAKVEIKSRRKLNSKKILELYESGEKASVTNKDADDASAPIAEAKLLFESIIKDASESFASDVHFCVRKKGAVVLFRIFGELVKYKQLNPDYLAGILSAVFNKCHDPGSNSEPAFSEKLRAYCTIALPQIERRLRWQTVPHGVDAGFDVVTRIIKSGLSDVVKTLPELGYLPDQTKKLTMIAKTPRGGIFIAGVTGSGKSTTLRTLMSIIKTGGKKKLYSVEDPIEYLMPGVSQIMVQRNEETTKNPFAEIMKMLMRSDPDVIMAGEIRDADTAQVSQDIIRTGHQLLTTVHANSAMGIVGRLTSRDIGMDRDTIAEPDFVAAMVYQHLIPLLCPKCKVPAELDDDMQYHLFDPRRYALRDRENIFFRGAGCPDCRGGIGGLTVCAEIIKPDYIMLNMIGEGRNADALRQYRSTRTAVFDSDESFGKTAIEVGVYKVSAGLVDPRDVESTFGAFGLEEVIGVS